MTKIYTTYEGQKPTSEQLKEVEEAKKQPIVFDSNCPELSPAMLKALRSVAMQRDRRRNA